MKRLFALFASPLLLVGLSGLLGACGSNELTNYTSREYETYNGEFKSLGGIEVQDKITHLFETDDGDILYAYSDRYDLDDDAYFGKRVEAYGVLSVYEELDKPLFEVKRITDAAAVEDPTAEVTQVPFQDPDLGFSMSYPSDWTLQTSITSVTLTAPQPVVEPNIDENGPAVTLFDPDFIFIAQVEAVLTKTAEDSQEDRAAEIRDYVKTNYADLATIQGELAYAGPDRLFSVHYKTSDSDSLYFIPRGDELFELSYNHASESDEDRLTNGNIFSSLVTGFRFTALGETLPETTEDTETDELVEEPETTTETTTTEQVTVNSYRELESKTFEFKMNYPGSWYYNGSSTGYDFSDKPVDSESTTEAILHMEFNKSKTEGVSRSGTTVSVTVKAGDRYYTVSGPAEYEAVMQAMANSITSTKVE